MRAPCFCFPFLKKPVEPLHRGCLSGAPGAVYGYGHRCLRVFVTYDVEYGADTIAKIELLFFDSFGLERVITDNAQARNFAGESVELAFFCFCHVFSIHLGLGQ